MSTIFKDQIVYETYGETIAVGDVLYMSQGTGSDSGRTAGRLYKLEIANADRNVFYGIAKESGNAADANKKVVTGGRFDGLSGLTKGLPVYANPASPGGVTQVRPSSNVQVIGVAIEADSISVNSALAGSFGAGEGSGSGVGGVDILFVQDFETAALGDFTQTGLTLSATDPLRGSVSALLTHQPATSQSFKQVIPVDRKFRGESMTMRLNVKSNASAGNVTLNIYDETNTDDIVASEQLQLANDVSGALNQVGFTIPDTCASLSYTITALQEAGSPVTRVDDIIAELAVTSQLEAVVELTGDAQTLTIPLTQSGLVRDADSMIRLSTANGYGSTATKIRRFATVFENRGNDVLYTDSAVNGASFTILKSGVYSVTYSDYQTPSNVVSVSKNADSFLTTNASTLWQDATNNKLLLGVEGSASSTYTHFTWTGYLEEGDILRPHTDGAAANDSDSCNFTITHQGSLKQVSVNPNSKITIPTSELRYEGASSRGAVATAIVRFDTLAKLRGDAFSIVSTADDGTAITMLKKGKLNISASLTANISTAYLSLNQSVLTAVPASASQVIAAQSIDSNGNLCSLSSELEVNVGDVIRVSCSQTPSSNTGNSLNLFFQEQDIAVSVTNVLPQFSESDSSVRLSGANGFGSTATTTRRFSTVAQNLGTDIEYIDSATLGAQFIAKSAGVYHVSYSELTSANSAQITNSINLNGTDVAFGEDSLNTANSNQKAATCAWSGYLAAGDTISPRVGVAADANGLSAVFTISKVGKPNVTGVDVTPFVNVPQPQSQSALLNSTSAYNGSVINGALTSSVGSGIFSYNATTGIYTVIKKASLTVTITMRAAGAGTVVPSLFLNSALIGQDHTEATAGRTASCSWTGQVSPGDILNASNGGSNNANLTVFSFYATALSDQILTAPETFSSDTASFTYANAATYTLSTLQNAPVGTYITFTYAASTNTRTQTVGANRPTQTDADMNTNGVRLFTRVYAAASTPGNPSAIAIQIGKGMKGKSLDLYKSANKVTAGSLDFYLASSNAVQGGALYKEYNELTGILYIDLGITASSSVATNGLQFSDLTAQNDGYIVINASKNPALTGLGLGTVAARAVQTSGQSIGNTLTLVNADSTKPFDSAGSMASSTMLFTAPETGYYQVNSSVQFSSVSWTAGQFMQLYLYKNGVFESALDELVLQAAITNTLGLRGSDVIFLKKGDTASIYARASRGATALATTAGYTYFSIHKTSVGSN